MAVRGEFEHLKTVLVVDDDYETCTFIATCVEAEGLSVRVARDGLEALESLAEELCDLLITDLAMPRMNGVTLLEQCRRRGMHFPVIVMSGSAEYVDPGAIVLRDCCATLMSKPLALDVLRQALAAADARTHHRDCVHERASPAGR